MRLLDGCGRLNQGLLDLFTLLPLTYLIARPWEVGILSVRGPFSVGTSVSVMETTACIGCIVFSPVALWLDKLRSASVYTRSEAQMPVMSGLNATQVYHSLNLHSIVCILGITISVQKSAELVENVKKSGRSDWRETKICRSFT